MKTLITLVICCLTQLVYSQTLTAISSFGTNPGNLNMYTYVPAGVSGPAPLVMVLHGCTQNATQAAAQTGWNKLADAHKFYLVYPEQKTINNSSSCFNWFLTADQEKNQGEDLSLKQMIDYMKSHYTIDSTKVFATGLSAGAGMTSVLCATYPEVFAGGAIMSGAPYKSATNAFEASSAMSGFVTNTPSAWANLVTAQNPGYTGNYPKIAVFHGTADPVVNITNATELVKQWTAVHGTDQTADATINPYTGNSFVTYNAYTNGAGNEYVRSYIISSFGHAIALDTGSCIQQGGQTGTYAYDINFHSTWHAAHFFGIVDSTSNTLAINGPTLVNTNQSNVSYSVNSNMGSTYTWTVPNGATIVSGQGSNTIVVNFASTPGLVSIYENNSSSCLNGPEQLFVNMCTCIGLEEMNGSSSLQLSILNNQTLQIKGLTGKHTTLYLHDVLGKALLQTATFEKELSVDISNLNTSGFYLVRVVDEDHSRSQKIFIR